MIRLLDILFSLCLLIILSPLMIIIVVLIGIELNGPIIFKQIRVGKQAKVFKFYKFRTMKLNSEQKGQLTVGFKDNRITQVGYFLRKYKLDELPQLYNVLKGDMSFVGPRPEVQKYVDLYSEEQRKVLSVKPGITDYASIEFVHENEILAQSQNPEETYITQILPKKIELNFKYIENKTIYNYFKIILLTIKSIIKHEN